MRLYPWPSSVTLHSDAFDQVTSPSPNTCLLQAETHGRVRPFGAWPRESPGEEGSLPNPGGPQPCSPIFVPDCWVVAHFACSCETNDSTRSASSTVGDGADA